MSPLYINMLLWYLNKTENVYVAKHNQTAHKVIRILCEFCDNKFTHNTNLDKHMKKT